MRNSQLPTIQKITLFEKMLDIDQLRSLALSNAGSYHDASSPNAQMLLGGRAKWIVDSIPLYNECVAEKVAEKHMELARTATMSSINRKILQLGNDTVGGIIAFTRTQKKDSMYDFITSPLSHLELNTPNLLI